MPAGANRDMVNYFIETTDGVYRTQVPPEWGANWKQEREYSAVVFSDDTGKDRLIFNNVLSFRDSVIPIQSMSATVNEEGGVEAVEWTDISEGSPISSYAMERVIERRQREQRRRRRSSSNAELRYEDEPRQIPFR